MKTMIRRYGGYIVSALAFTAFLFILPVYREKSLSMIVLQAKTMLLVIPPIFILLGLLDVWVPREKMMKFMGPGSRAAHPPSCSDRLPRDRCMAPSPSRLS